MELLDSLFAYSLRRYDLQARQSVMPESGKITRGSHEISNKNVLGYRLEMKKKLINAGLRACGNHRRRGGVNIFEKPSGAATNICISVGLTKRPNNNRVGFTLTIKSPRVTVDWYILIAVPMNRSLLFSSKELQDMYPSQDRCMMSVSSENYFGKDLDERIHELLEG